VLSYICLYAVLLSGGGGAQLALSIGLETEVGPSNAMGGCSSKLADLIFATRFVLVQLVLIFFLSEMLVFQMRLIDASAQA
jgi:hypothetical protein